MHPSRRSFLKQFAAVSSALLSGCLGEAYPSQSTITLGAQSSAALPPTSGAGAAAAPVAEAVPVATSSSVNTGPVWQAAPTIEFVEGVPAAVSVRDFVRDPDNNPLVIALASGTLMPGLTWNSTNATIAYDGRAFGAEPDRVIVVTGITFVADDGGA